MKLAQIAHRLGLAEREAQQQPPVELTSPEGHSEWIYASLDELDEVLAALRLDPPDEAKIATIKAQIRARQKADEFPPGATSLWRLAMEEGRAMTPLERWSFERARQRARRRFETRTATKGAA